MVHQIGSEEEFEETIQSGDTVVVDFTATWCGNNYNYFNN